MDGEEFDQFEEIDDDLLGMLPLDDIQSKCVDEQENQTTEAEDKLSSADDQSADDKHQLIITRDQKDYKHGNYVVVICCLFIDLRCLSEFPLSLLPHRLHDCDS